MRPLALLGGTFDPIHNAHLRVAWEAAAPLATRVSALADEDLVVPAADRLEPEVPVVVDMRDHDADLVDVALDHHRWAGPREARIGVAHRIDDDLVGEGGGLVAPGARRLVLEPGRAGGRQQPLQECPRLILHSTLQRR